MFTALICKACLIQLILFESMSSRNVDGSQGSVLAWRLWCTVFCKLLIRPDIVVPYRGDLVIRLSRPTASVH